jgi:hypothetical protein
MSVRFASSRVRIRAVDRLVQEKVKQKHVSSDFGVRKFVEDGVVETAFSFVGTSGWHDRFWVLSSLPWCSHFMGGVSVVAFERGSALEGIAESVFYGSALRSIMIPSSIIVLGKSSFGECRSLEYVIFENGSRVERIERLAFALSGLNSIVIPSSVVVLGESCFGKCESLESVVFESGSRLERIEDSAFCGSGLNSIVIPSGVVAFGKSSFATCKWLEAVIKHRRSVP